MTNVTSIAGMAALIGDPARAAMLMALMDGRALTAGELAGVAGVTPPTASGHLGRLLDGGLLALERQGRHRYYRIADRSVAGLLETMMSLGGELATGDGLRKPIRTGPRDLALRRARLCYDHLAGELAVAMADRMIERGLLDFDQEGGAITDQGLRFLAGLGVEVERQRSGATRATFCRPCLDWSERRPHIAGVVGRAMCDSFTRLGWLRVGEARHVTVTTRGKMELARHFEIALA